MSDEEQLDPMQSVIYCNFSQFFFSGVCGVEMKNLQSSEQAHFLVLRLCLLILRFLPAALCTLVLQCGLTCRLIVMYTSIHFKQIIIQELLFCAHQ